MSSGCIELTFYQRWDVSACHHRIHKNIMPSALPYSHFPIWDKKMKCSSELLLCSGKCLSKIFLEYPKAQVAGPGFLTPHGVNSSKISSSLLTAVHQPFFFLPKPVLAPLLSANRGKRNTFLLSILVIDVLVTFWSIPIIWEGGHLTVTYPGIPSDVFEEAVVLYPTAINFSRYFSLWFEWFSQSIPAFWSPWKYRL